MKRLLVLFMCAAMSLSAVAQTQQQLIEAYRNGTLTQSQIDALQKQSEQKQNNIQRTRSNNTMQNNSEAVNGVVLENIGYNNGINNQLQTVVPQQTNVNLKQEPKRIITGMPADPQRGLLDTLDTDSASVVGVLTRRIFGHDMFTNARLTFEPNLNIATPENYVLGPGDEVIIDTWGDAQTAESYTISPEGKIVIQGVGPVTLVGLSIGEATRRVRSSLATIYEGLHDGSVKMKLSLGSIRSIQVNVTGEVGTSGTYTLPSLATLFHALHTAGGVNNLGTMRSIKVYRGGKLFSEVDVYDYILNGKAEKDIALRDGDLITIPAYGKLVEISGEIKRPMFYEMKSGETIADLIAFAGDFTNEANRKIVSVTRRQGGQYESFTVDSANFGSFVLEDGDMVSVAGSIDRYENRVEVKGAVYREGHYAIDDKVQTIKQLIARADGLREDAFMARAVLYREKPDWTMEAQAIDLAGLMAGRVADVKLRANDILVIASVSDMREEYNVTVFGSVAKPDTYPYAENMTVEDLLVAAGGLLESASTANITITRRIKDSKSVQVRDDLFETFNVQIADGLAVGEGSGFILKPFDQVYVRRSPVYISQSSVTVQGEVAFEGNYPLSHRNMRLSEVVAAAGGTNPGAFIEGAYLIRKMTDEEQNQNVALKSLIDKQANNPTDSLSLGANALSTVYSVGINLEEALDNPGSSADVVLRDGDVLSIPLYNGTVRVMGAVMYPNSVTYSDGMKLKDCVKAAGGFDNRARRNRAFVIYMNGMVDAGKSAKIRPGCIVIIPSKSPSEPVKWSEVVGMLSSTASTAAVVLSAINLAK